ncbi:MAG TPA: PAS domain S-box protein [Desulfuromonadales bacterium]|nr:PAS domain S-box protein [Desulfuromonadales bacterium]
MTPIIEARLQFSLTGSRPALSVSDGITRLLGYTPDTFLDGSVSLKERIHADDQDIADVLFSAESTVLSGTFNMRLRDSEGRVRCVKGEYVKLPEPSAHGLVLDLTLWDAKSLWQNVGAQPLLDAMMDNTQDFIYFKDPNHVFTGASQTLVAITNPSEHWSDLLGLTDYDVFPEHLADVYYRLEKQVFSGIAVAHEIQKTLDNDGVAGWVDNRKYPLKNSQGEITGLFGIARIITPEKQAETSLLESNAYLENLINYANAPIIVWDPQFRITRFNHAFESITGRSEAEVLGQSLDILFPPELVSQSMGQISKTLTGERWETVEIKILHRDESVRTVLWNSATLFALDGQTPIATIAQGQDITERKQILDVQSYLLELSSLNTGEDFFESLARYLATILGMDYVCIDTLHGDCLSARTLAIYHDGKFEDNVEYTLKDTPCGDVVGKKVCIFPQGVCSLFPHDAALQDLQAESYVGTTLWSFDMKPIGLIAVIGRKELNRYYFVETVLKLVAIRAAGELERRQAEAEKLIIQQQFQQTQKLESLGVLSGGIAHDFNNILAVIMGYCGLTKMDYNTAEKHIPQIENAVERAAALCRQMLAYAGKATLTQTVVVMWVLVDEVVSMLKATIKQNAVIKTHYSADISSFTGDASQLRQVVMNLIINAAEAIGDVEGEIDVSLSKVEIKADQSEKDHLGMIIPAGRYICFEVNDNGCGMDDDTRRKIFEPFYTTKFTGRGLGMSAALGIIKAHKGSLQLESRLGHGTTFKVYLPVPISEFESEEANQKTASAAWQGSGTILLAEDEVQVKSIAIELLQILGFNVLDAANGKEALELYQQNAADITLVVTDIGMPVMNGYELFYKLKQFDPQLPIIISSGFGEGDIASKIPREAMAGLINKPYKFEQLREVLKGVMEGA